MSFAEQQYRAHLERQRRLGKIPATPSASAVTQPVATQAPAGARQSEALVASPAQAKMIQSLQQDVAQLSARLKAIVREDESPLLVPSRIKSVMAAVAEYYDISLGDLLSSRRAREISRPRQVAMYLAKALTKHSLPAIGRMLERDHTTVLHGCRQIEKLRLKDPELDTEIRELTDLLTAGEQAARG
jgi:chromosomal replication initiator protein